MTTPGVPLCAPPGLEPNIDAASFVADVAASNSPPSTAMLQAVEAKLKELIPDAPLQAITAAIQDSLLAEVEIKVKEKATELWSRGKHIVQQLQQKHKDHTQKLMAELEECQLKQKELEAGNAQLKLALQGMTARCTLLGQGYLAKDLNMLSPDVSTAPGLSVAPSEGTPSQGTPTTQASSSPNPPISSAVTGGCETPKLLPGVPGFPFPSVGGLQAAPLSLTEALGQATPPGGQPVSLVNSLTAAPAQAMSAPFANNHQSNLGFLGASGIFSFTLRKADATDLGLKVSHFDGDLCLRVEGVNPEGAVDAWNKACLGTMPGKIVFPGDRIISVNKIQYDPDKMLEECKDKQLLKLTIARGDVDLPLKPSPEGVQSAGKHELRADASVFVPTTGATESNVTETDSSAIAAASEPQVK